MEMAVIGWYADEALKEKLAIDEIWVDYHARTKPTCALQNALTKQWAQMAADLLGMERRKFAQMCGLVAAL